MMDTQRLIALVIFSFSALLLWDAWQKHNAPQHVAPPASATAPSSVPAPSAQALHAPSPAAPPAPAVAASVPVGKQIKVETDLFEVDINSIGGDIRRLTLRKVFSAQDRTLPLTLMEPDPQHYFVTQSGLLGEGLPTHKTPYEAQRTSYVLGAGQDALEVRLTARGADGVEVVKHYRFHRGSYQIDVGYDVTNKSGKALAPFAYFQFLRDGNPPGPQAAQTSHFGGVSTFTGPAIYTEEAKFRKISFSDIDKGKASTPTKAKDGWIAIVQHYFVSAWLPKEGGEREFFTNKVGNDLYTAGVVVPVGAIAPGATASVDVPAYIGPQEKDRLAKAAPGLNLVVDYGWLKPIAAPLFWLLKTIHGFVGNWGWSIILLTIVIKLTFYPLNAKASRSMAQMKVLAPKMEKLKRALRRGSPEAEPGDDGALSRPRRSIRSAGACRSSCRFRCSSRSTGCCSPRSSCATPRGWDGSTTCPPRIRTSSCR